MATSSPQDHASAEDRVPLRLQIWDHTQSDSSDGAWWPQSRDLQTEAADLVDHFPVATGRVSRLLFSRPDWDHVPGTPSPRRIRAARGPIKVGSFPEDDTHLMTVKLSSGVLLDVRVVPSDASPREAELAMAPTT